MNEMYEIGCKISKASTGYYFVPLIKWPHGFVVCVVGLLRSLNMNTQEFALSQLKEHKLCLTSETHVDVVVLVVQVVFVCLIAWHV